MVEQDNADVRTATENGALAGAIASARVGLTDLLPRPVHSPDPAILTERSKRKRRAGRLEAHCEGSDESPHTTTCK